MSILRKSIDEITTADLEELCAHQIRETNEIEFKKDLPFQRVKGQSGEADRWITRGDRVGEYARDRILAELIAFANADGGTLLLGVDETDDDPRRAKALTPLPRCEDLARRLADSCEDVIEPRLPLVATRALPLDGEAGVVILRVGRSAVGPHRLASDGQFYTRRGERSVKMTVREVRDAVLDMARRGDEVAALFRERTQHARKNYDSAWAQSMASGTPARAVLIRVTALPVSKWAISGLTQRLDLWWPGRNLTATRSGAEQPLGFAARRFEERPEIALRSFKMEGDHFRRVLTADGLIEAYVIHTRKPEPGKVLDDAEALYLGWLIALVAGVLAQIEHLRRALANDGAEFALQVEIEGSVPLVPAWGDHRWSGYGRPASFHNIEFPPFPVGSMEGFGQVLDIVLRDVFNHTGTQFNSDVEVDWEALVKRQ